MTTHPPIRIALLVYEGCMGLEVFGISDLLLIAQHVARAMGRVPARSIETQLVGVQKRNVTAAGGLVLKAQRPRGHFDWLIVPGVEVVQGSQWPAKLASLEPELTFIRASFAQGSQVASICVGSFLLGQAGLLNDRHATTAWIMAKELARMYPLAKVNSNALLLEDGAVITSGAMTSTFDLVLHIIKRTMGADVASATASIALLPQPRSSQAPYIDPRFIAPTHQAVPSFSDHVTQWLVQRLIEPYQLSRLSQAFHVSPRTMMRRVKTETGHTPLAILQQARIAEAKLMLRNTRWSIPTIVNKVGYSDVPTFSRLFEREVGETPARFRSRK